MHFIIQAQKSIGIKKEIEENKDKEVIVVDYKINEEEAKKKAPSGKEDVRLLIVLGLVLYGRLPEKPLIRAKMFGNLLITAYDSGG